MVGEGDSACDYPTDVFRKSLEVYNTLYVEQVNTRAKRRTLYEVKSSRNQQQTQHWIPSRTDDLIDD